MRVIPSIVQSRRSVSAHTHTVQLPFSTLTQFRTQTSLSLPTPSNNQTRLLANLILTVLILLGCSRKCHIDR